MKISLNWLKDFIPVDKSTQELKDLLTDIGLEAEGVEEYDSHPGGLRGLVVAEVLTCEPHPDADKLKVTTVDDGSGEIRTVVCGAPNVAAGQKVVLATTGTVLYPVGGEAFEIKKAKIRGVASEGMLCAEDEIGIGHSHDGIIVLPAATPVGTPVANIYEVVRDQVFEIGLTPNRTDAFSHYGVARDLAAAISFREKKKLNLPAIVAANFVAGSGKPLKVEVLNPVACPRYAGLVIEGLHVAPSPDWLKHRLLAIGQKPINNVVDITNYILHTYGQPLHAFDLHAIKGKTIKVGMLPAETGFTTLDNAEIKLHAEDLMICDAESGMCLAGVYGGAFSGVKESTTAIFLESAYFNPSFIRRSSMRHGLRTEAAQHFEKGADPVRTVDVLKIAAQMICEIAGGKISSEVYDLQADIRSHQTVSVSKSKVRRLTGSPVQDEEIHTILALLEMEIVAEENDVLTLHVPSYRSDVTRDVDVIEDILRIYGYNNVPLPKRFSAAVNVQQGFDPDKLYRNVAAQLCSLGFHEMVNNSIARSRQLEGLIDPEQQVKLLSSINVELDTLRPLMHVSALEVLQHNINRSQKNLRLFEFGKTYIKEEGSFRESRHLLLALTGDKQKTNWISPGQKIGFYYLKGVVNQVLSRLGLEELPATELSDPLYDEGLEIARGKQVMVRFGKMSALRVKESGIKQEVWIADFQWDNILKAVAGVKKKEIFISRFPAVRRDLALLLDKNIKFTELKNIAFNTIKKQLREVDLFDVYEGDKIEEGKKSYAVSFVFRDDDKTLQDAEIESAMDKLIKQYQKQLNAVVRGQA